MANDIESQIASYFTWVEAGVGTALHREIEAGDAREVSDAALREIVGLERQYHQPERTRTPRPRRRMIVVAVAAAACLAIGAIALAASSRNDDEQQPVVTPDQTTPDRTVVTVTPPVTSTSIAEPVRPSTQSLLAASVAADEPLYFLSTDPDWPLERFAVAHNEVGESPELLIVGDGLYTDRPVIGVSAGLERGSQYVDGNTATSGASESAVRIGDVDGTAWLSTRAGVPISVLEWPVPNGYFATMMAIGLDVATAVDLANHVVIDDLTPRLSPTEGYRTLVLDDAAVRVHRGLFARTGQPDAGIEVDCSNSGEAGAAAGQLGSMARFEPYPVGDRTIARRVGEFGPSQTELDGAIWMAGDWFSAIWSSPLDVNGGTVPVFESEDIDRLLRALVVVDESTLRSSANGATLNLGVPATTTVPSSPEASAPLAPGQLRVDPAIATPGEWFATFTKDGTKVVAAGRGATQVIDIDGSGSRASLPKGLAMSCDDLGVSPDGSLVWDGTSVRDSATGQAVLTPTIRGSVPTGAFSSDGSLLAIAGNSTFDGTLVLDIASGAEVRRVHGGNANHNFCPEFAANDQQLFTQELIGSARFWDIATGDEVATVQTDDALADLSPDGRFVAVNAEPYILVEVATGDVVFAYTGRHVAFSPNTAMMAETDDDGPLRIWDLQTREVVATIPATAGDGRIRDEMFSPDGSRIIVTSDGSAVIYDTATGAPLTTLEDSGVETAYFSPDGTRIVTAHTDRTVRVRASDATDPQTSNDPALADGAFQVVPSRSDWFATFTKDGERVIAAGSQQVRLVDPVTGPFDALPVEAYVLNGCDELAVSPDGSLIWDGGSLRDTVTGQAMLTPELPAEPSGAAFSEDGSLLALTTRANTSLVIDVATGARVFGLAPTDYRALCPEFTANDQQLFVQGLIGFARFWDLGTGDEVASVSLGDAVANLSPDGRFVAVYGEVHQLVDVERHVPVLTFSSSTVAFSPNGALMVEAAGVGLRIWDLETAHVVSEMPGAGTLLRDEMFSPDGSRILVVAAGGAAVYATATGAPLTTVDEQGSGVVSAFFSPDGSQIVTAYASGVVRVRPAP